MPSVEQLLGKLPVVTRLDLFFKPWLAAGPGTGQCRRVRSSRKRSKSVSRAALISLGTHAETPTVGTRAALERRVE